MYLKISNFYNMEVKVCLKNLICGVILLKALLLLTSFLDSGGARGSWHHEATFHHGVPVWNDPLRLTSTPVTKVSLLEYLLFGKIHHLQPHNRFIFHIFCINFHNVGKPLIVIQVSYMYVRFKGEKMSFATNEYLFKHV